MNLFLILLIHIKFTQYLFIKIKSKIKIIFFPLINIKNIDKKIIRNIFLYCFPLNNFNNKKQRRGINLRKKAFEIKILKINN